MSTFTPGPGTKFLFYSGGVVPSGTANGVLYLNGSKVVSSGSALTFDGTNFATTGISSSTNANGLRAYYPSNSAYYSQLDNRDGNLYLSAVGAGAMQIFLAGGSERMRLDSSGNLGIGTSSPTTKLDVFSSTAVVRARVRSVWSNAYLEISRADGSSEALLRIQQGATNSWDIGYQPTETALQFINLGSERMRLTSGGNLGIGTTSPVGKLDNRGVSYLGSDSNNSLYVESTSTLVTIGAAGRSSFSTSALRFLTSDGTNALERMRLTSDGDLAIGATSTSGYRFFVSGNVYLAGTSHFIDANTITFRSAAAVERVKIPSAGGLVIGPAAIATTATDGFLYVPTCAGTPTGTPTTQTGTAPIVIDTTNHKLYFYSGGTWRDAGP